MKKKEEQPILLMRKASSGEYTCTRKDTYGHVEIRKVRDDRQKERKVFSLKRETFFVDLLV